MTSDRHDTILEANGRDVLRDRRIGSFLGNGRGPTMVIFAGIHGNEPAGVQALQSVFHKLDTFNKEASGNVYGIAGNLGALRKGRRYLKTDLNRLWHEQNIQDARAKHPANRLEEETELLELHAAIEGILKKHEPPYYFIDLHTTSSKTLPFITINDALINRKFAQCFPAPIILGIEEYLDGPLLSYLNGKGYLAIGFESGQHMEKSAVWLAEDFVWLSLVHSGILPRNEAPFYTTAYEQLNRAANGNRHFYEITYRQPVGPEDTFTMLPGYASFQKVGKGTLIATFNGEAVHITTSEKTLFMPLYQKEGEDGYFFIRGISSWILSLSEILRRIRLDRILPLLPGIARMPGNPSILLANPRWTPFLRKQFFHLLGYRHRFIHNGRVAFSNREQVSRKRDYRECDWFRGIIRNFK